MASVYEFGPFVFDAAAYRLRHGDRTLPLSPKVLDLLRLLASRSSELVTKEDIHRELWPDVAVTDNAVTQVVSDLRQALGDDHAAPQYVQTVPRRGYRFIATVSPLAAPGVAIHSSLHHAQPRPLGRTIAVSDFQNVNLNPDVGWMAAGIAETVTNDLRVLRDLHVIDRTTLPDGVRRASIEAARAGGLDLLVVGSYQHVAGRLRITARAIEARSGEAIAHSKADGAIEDVFELQDRIVTQLLDGLQVPVTGAEAARIGVSETSSIEAYRAVTEGRLKLETLNPGDVPAAIRLFDRAIVIDPRYAYAYVGLAHARLWLYEASRARNGPDTDELRVAIAHARRAVELDAGLAEAHAALAFLLASAGCHAEAVESGRVAVALEPNNWRHRFRLGTAAWGAERLACLSEVVRLFPEFSYSYFGTAMVHVARADLRTAEECLRQGIAVQQRSSLIHGRFPARGNHWLLGLVHLARGEVRDARHEFDRELDARGCEMYAAEYAIDAHDGHGFAALAIGDLVEATAMFDRALAVYPDHARSLLGLSEARRRLGDREAARAALEAARRAVQELQRNSRHTEAAMVTAIDYALSGRLDESVATLRHLLDAATPGFAGWTIPVEPLLTCLQRHPGFQSVLTTLAKRAL